MGERTRNHDWLKTSLGTPDQWPPSLQTTVGLVLHSGSPMLLFWGSELLCFYNDAFRPSLGDNGKHPASLGQPAQEVWNEVWAFTGPLLDQVRATGEAVWFEDQLVPIYRNNRLEDVYWTFSYSPAFGNNGQIDGVLVSCTETTQQVNAISQLQASEQRFQNLVRETAVGIIVLEGEEMRVSVVNNAYARLIDRSREALMGKPLFTIIPEAEAIFRPIIDGVRLTGESLFLYEQPYFVYVDGAEKSGFLDLVYQPYRELDGRIAGVMVICQDITSQVTARQKIEESEARFRTLVNESPVATCLFVGQELIIDVANELMVYFFGRGPSIVGKPVREVLTGQVGDGSVIALLEQVFTTGEPYTAMAAPAELTINGKRGTYYFDLSLKPLRNTDGAIYAVLETATDVTEKVLTQQQLKMSEARFRNIVEQAPMAIGLLKGRELVIEVGNKRLFEVWGKDSAILGRRLIEALPELDGQVFIELLERVYDTGEPFFGYGVLAKLMHAGKPEDIYFDFVYTPVLDGADNISGVMVLATEVTQQVLARQKVKEAESTLRSAIELAELGTWQLDLSTGLLDYSDRLRGWFDIGPDELITVEKAYSVMQEADRPLVKANMLRAIADGSDGIYDIEYRVEGQERILRAQGKAHRTPQGKAYKVSGTVQDVTRQRLAQFALEQQVQQRTQQLQASVQDLERSNRNLQQFAYVASHDLQEPLRKIQSFGDLLRNQYAAQLGDGADHLQRIQTAAARMSTLIKDLLSYSRIATQQDTTATVSLTEVMHSVLLDLDLRMQESGAVIDVDPLPTVQGDKSQLGQLFQNLVSNALKFQRVDADGVLVAPRIRISTRELTASDLPHSLKPVRAAAIYCQINITDNGIGFEQRYADRIFQVFQRLHGRNQYAGTGIGLAICEKVVANHGGAITATGKPGEGATFSVYLPV